MSRAPGMSVPAALDSDDRAAKISGAIEGFAQAMAPNVR